MPAAGTEFSSRLSRISACASLASPCTTLMRSNTTRRSAPITRSRLRRPTSKSTTATFLPVLRERRAERGGRGGLADAALARCHDQYLGHLPYLLSVRMSVERRRSCIASPFEPGLHRLAAKSGVDTRRRSCRSRRWPAARLRSCGRRCARGRLPCDAGRWRVRAACRRCGWSRRRRSRRRKRPSRGP